MARAPSKTGLFAAAKAWDVAAWLQRLKTLVLLIEAGANTAIADRQWRDAVAIGRARRLPKELVSRLEALKRRTSSHTQRAGAEACAR